ncbi:PAS domain S-box-containing protein [Methanohalophilus levihalophilus]|uniref:PAS domain S-box protein n=1 Tax=Methanohalophilus levihalophilus TaxID=1431282 RepID=UPI001AE1448D|nr:PAS domain S-box protein [Methanohalophilus levihalophilus]MBP2029187.1 PAS domain S-box-containing protein [Methanohalophilus levihalophilus]
MDLSKKILDSVSMGVWAVDKDKKFVYFNPGMEKITGLKEGEVLGKELKTFLSPTQQSVGDEAHFRELFRKLQETLEPTSYKSLPIITKDGAFSFQNGHLIPLLDKNGKYDGMVCTVEKVVERKISQKTLRDKLQSKETLQQIYRNSPVVAFLCTAEENWPLEFISENVSQFGYSIDDFISGKMNFGTWIHPEDLEGVKSDVTELEIGGRAYFSKEYRVLTKDGNTRWVTERSYLGRDEMGNPSYFQGILIDITPRKMAEDAMLESEKNYHLIFENSPLGIFNFDSDGVVTHSNDNIVTILGTPKDKILGFNMLTDLQDEKMADAVKAVFRKEQGHYEGKYCSTFSEKVTPIKADFSPNIAEDGTLLGGVGIVEDISERMKAEEALRLDESRLETLVKLNQMSEASLQEIIDFAREEGVRLTSSNMGYIAFVDEEEMIMRIVSWTDNAMNRCKVKDKKLEYKIRKTGLWGEAVRKRKLFINNNYNDPNPLKSGYSKGHVEIVRHMDVPIFEEDKVVALAGVANKMENYDNSDARQLTLLMQGMWRLIQRRKSEEKIKKSEDKFRTIFSSTNDAIFLHDFDGDLLEVNRAAYEKLGYSREEMLSMNTMDLNTRLSMEEIPERINYLKEKGNAIFEATYENKDGTAIPVEISARIIEYDDKPSILVVARDITERKRAEEELKRYAEELAEANEELKSLDKMKDEFLSNVSHELKTPLTSIKGYTQLLSDGTLGELNEEQLKAQNTVARNSERLKRLVESLLYLSRIQAGTVEYFFEPLQIEEILAHIQEDLKIQASQKKVNLELKLDKEMPLINGDRDKLTDMITNIVDNAIKFTPEEGNVTVSGLAEDEGIHIIVKDSGIGIPKEMIGSLFQRFYQIDSSRKRKYGGTGLGLYISKTIAEAHHGTIWIESEGEGKGTEVHISLPVSDTE